MAWRSSGSTCMNRHFVSMRISLPRRLIFLPVYRRCSTLAMRGAVVATFQIEWVGLPQEVVNDSQRSPMWAQFEAMAQSAVYDAVITTDLQRPTAQMAAVVTPTLVLQGDPTWPVLATATAGIARRLPKATHRILPVEAVHGIDPGGTAEVIREFEQ
jgi:hypothetical protein